MEHSELIETAGVNYLAGLGAAYWDDLLANADGNLRIYPGESNLDMDGQTIVVYLDGDLGEEYPPCSGNRWADVIFRLKTPVIKKRDGLQLKSHQANADALQRAILDISLPLLLMAAVPNFTCFGLTDRTPFREQDATGWVSGFRVRIYSCPTAFPN